MKIGIVLVVSLPQISSKGLANTMMLKHVAVQRGHKVKLYYSNFLDLYFDRNVFSLTYRGKDISAPDVIFSRYFNVSNFEMMMSPLCHFELMGIPNINTFQATLNTKIKVRSLQIMQQHRIPIPKTVVVFNKEYLNAAILKIGKFPMILKTPHGTHGSGVVIIESRRSMNSIMDLLAEKTATTPLILQEYINEARGRDIRIFVLNNEVVAAMQRRAKKGEFRSNFSIGGATGLIELTEEEMEISRRAARAHGLYYAGVDIIRSKNGPKVLEVNSTPGFQGITEATNINVADKLIAFAEMLVQKKPPLVHS